MNDTKTVRGSVEAVARNKPDRFGLKVGGAWFDGFGSSPVEKGDEVEVDYVENGRYRNIQEVRLVQERKADSADAENDRETHIARAVALKCATRLCEGKPANVADVLALAEKLVEWLSATPRRNVQEDARAVRGMHAMSRRDLHG